MSDWPLVGRDRELTEIGEVMTGSDLAGVVLAGEVGVGKTRLAREVVRKAAAAGTPTAVVTATATASTIPLAALAGLLPPEFAFQENPNATLAAAVHGISARFHVPPVLVVDDAHHLDPASAVVVRQLAEDRRAFLVVTLRAGEPTLDAVAALWKDGLAKRMTLESLDRGAITGLLEHILGAGVDGMSLERLWQASRGNTLLLSEIVRAGIAAGSFVPQDGVYRWQGPLAVDDRLRDLVGLRLGGLDRSARDALELLAIAEPLDLAILKHHFGPAVLYELERTQLVAMEHSGHRRLMRFTHPIYGEVLRTSIGPLRASELRLEVADALERSGARRSGDALRSAAMRVDAGTPGDPARLIEAARHAHEGMDDRLAERLARAAVDAGGGEPAVRLLAQVLFWIGDWDGADAACEQARHLESSEEGRLELAERRASILFYARGRADEALGILTAAATSATDPLVAAELRCVQASHLLFMGRVAEAIELTAPIFADRSGSPRLRVRAALGLVGPLGLAGRASEALSCGEEALQLAARISAELPDARHRLMSALILALHLAGRYGEAHERAAVAYERSLADRNREGAAYMSLSLGRVAVSQGRLAEAETWLREAVALSRDPGGISFLPFALASAAEAAAMRGDLEAAGPALAEAERMWHPALGFCDADLARARAWCLAAGGDLAAARDVLRAAAATAERVGAFQVAVIALHECARLDGADEAAGDLDRLAPGVDGPTAVLFAAHARALRSADGDGLGRCSAAFSAIGSPLLAAEAAAEAADVWRSADGRASAAQLTARARILLDECGEAKTPALGLLVANPLTPRERGIANLAARGLTTPAIAAQLGLSERTVESHLQHTYAKLGISSRNQLKGLFESDDL